MSWSSMWRRPAVSTMSTSQPVLIASRRALWQTGRASVIACAFVSGGAVYLQPRHRSDHFSFLLDVPPAGRGRAVFSAELFRRKETCAADRGCNPIAGDATDRK